MCDLITFDYFNPVIPDGVSSTVPSGPDLPGYHIYIINNHSFPVTYSHISKIFLGEPRFISGIRLKYVANRMTVLAIIIRNAKTAII